MEDLPRRNPDAEDTPSTAAKFDEYRFGGATHFAKRRADAPPLGAPSILVALALVAAASLFIPILSVFATPFLVLGVVLYAYRAFRTSYVE